MTSDLSQPLRSGEPAPTTGTAGQLADYADAHAPEVSGELQRLLRKAAGELRSWEVEKFEKSLASSGDLSQRADDLLHMISAIVPIPKTQSGAIRIILVFALEHEYQRGAHLEADDAIDTLIDEQKRATEAGLQEALQEKDTVIRLQAKDLETLREERDRLLSLIPSTHL